MAIRLFGFRFGRKEEEKDEKSHSKALAAPAPDGSLILETGSAGRYRIVYDLQGSIQNEADLIKKYREMSLYPEAAAGIDEVINDMVIMDEESAPVDIVVGDNLKFSDELKDKIYKEFKNVLNLLNFNNDAYSVCRRWYIDGKIHYQVIIDEANPAAGIQELRYIDPRCIRKIKEVKKEIDNKIGAEFAVDDDEYYLFNKMGFINQTNPKQTAGAVPISVDSIVYANSGIYNSENTLVLSYLHEAIKPYNQLRCMEDSLVIYRMSRAPERRIFNIDVGEMPPNAAKQYLQDIMTNYKNKLQYNPDTGEIRDDRRHSTILEDFWFPKRGDRTNEVTTLPAGQNLSEIEDVVYFQKKLYKALKIPATRLNPTTGFNIGKAAEISREEVKFSKFITRLRFQFSRLFHELLKRQLILKKITTEKDWEMMKDNIFYNFISDSYFAELKKSEILNIRLETLDKAEQYVNKYFSKEFVQREVLNQSEQEVEEIQKQIEEGKKPKKEKPKPEADVPSQEPESEDFPEESPEPEEVPEELPNEVPEDEEQPE